jgi:hypothetical protein
MQRWQQCLEAHASETKAAVLTVLLEGSALGATRLRGYCHHVQRRATACLGSRSVTYGAACCVTQSSGSGLGLCPAP